MLKYSLGIDVSKKEFYACLSVIDFNQLVKVKASRKFSNDAHGFKELLHWISKQRKESNIPFSVTIEATGCFRSMCLIPIQSRI